MLTDGCYGKDGGDLFPLRDCRFPDVEIVDKLEYTERGENGFGSTGR